MEAELETSFNDEDNTAYERYSDEEAELDEIKRKKLYPKCIIDSDTNSEGENNLEIKQEPQELYLTESVKNGHISNLDDGPREPELGADVSDMVQNLLKSRRPGISPLQCSECDLECPSRSALEFHTKLHVMERIVQSSYKYEGVGLKRPSEKLNIPNELDNEGFTQKSNASISSNAENNISNQLNVSKENEATHKGEAKDIETIMKSLVSQEASEETLYSNSGLEYSGEITHSNKCDECDFSFTSNADLKMHLLTHTSNKPYGCTECDYRCARKDRLKNHMLTHDPGQKLFACMECDYSSVRKDKLRDHMNSKHVSGQKLYACMECNYSTGRKDKLKNHMKKHLTQSDDPTTGEIKIKKIKRDQELKFNCPECDYKCTGTAILKLHMVKHSDERPFKCIECDSRFKAKNNLKFHMQTHLSNECFSCTHCKFTCPTKAQFTRHMLTHTGTKNHACPLCDYKCFEKGNLAKHMVIHGDDKPFSCPEEGCDYKCKLNSNLKIHMLRHSGEKTYACHICDYRAMVKGDFTTHMFKHTGEKPFPCSFCEKRFALKGDLNVHMRTHTNDKKFKCQYCDYRCFTKQRVNQHMMSHTGEKPHGCEECGAKFASTSNLRKHMRIHTGEKKPRSPRKSKFMSPKPNLGSSSTYTTMGDHSEVSNASSLGGYHSYHQGNTQPLNNQHIIGRSIQETTHQDGNYKIYSDNMEHPSLSKIYNNFPPSATKPLWHQGSSSIPAVNADGYNCQALSDMLLNTRKLNTQAGENPAHISQNHSHNPLANYSPQMFMNSLDLTHPNSKIPSTMPIPPNMSEMIRHANHMYNTQ